MFHKNQSPIGCLPKKKCITQKKVMALGGQHVSGFSPDGKLFALINEQGILKIWDTETNELKQEYTPNLHLSGPCSALTWAAVAQPKKSKKERKSMSSGLYIALGTSTGGVSLYSYSLGNIERNFKGEGHAGRITSIYYDKADKLYTCGEDCQVIIWNLPNEKQLSAFSIGNEKPNSVAYLEHSNNVVVGARQIKVYSVESQELVQTFTGHMSEVTLLTTFSTEGGVEYAVTASVMERIICLWKIGKKGRNKSPTCTLLMEDIAHSLSCKVDDEQNQLKVASATRSGVIHNYLIPMDALKAEKPIKPKVTIQIASESATVVEPIPAVAVSLECAPNNEIFFGYGDKHFMMFEHSALKYGQKLQVLVRTHPKTRFSKAAKKETTFGSALKTIRPLENENDAEYQTGATVGRKQTKPIDMPFETRLQNLNLSSGERPQPQSKVQLLIQALHIKDPGMLMSVLSSEDPKVIQMTLQRLPVQYVGTLVNELTLLMQKKRVNVEISANWLKVLAQTHSSQLMALGPDDLLDKFGPCIGIIEHRANCLMELSKLNGRLQLLVSQIKRNTEEDNLNVENALILEDNDSSNSDAEEVTRGKYATESEWEEEEDSVEEMES